MSLVEAKAACVTTEPALSVEIALLYEKKNEIDVNQFCLNKASGKLGSARRACLQTADIKSRFLQEFG